MDFDSAMLLQNKSTEDNRSKLASFIILLVIFLITSGCAIQPKVVSEAENKQRIAQDLLQLKNEHDPIKGPISLKRQPHVRLNITWNYRLS